MKNSVLVSVLVLACTGCTSLPTAKGPQASDPACTQACASRLEQCPQIFAAFPGRGAIECPAAHEQCLKACANGLGRATGAPATQAPPPPVSASASKEAELRELKRFHDEGLITDEVYVDRQKAILSEK
jgi:hypothetical protein